MPEAVPVNTARISFEIVETLREWMEQRLAERRPARQPHDHLQTLEAEESLAKGGSTYHAGTRFLQLGEQTWSRRKVFEIARAETDERAEETGQARQPDDRGHGWACSSTRHGDRMPSN